MTAGRAFGAPAHHDIEIRVDPLSGQRILLAPQRAHRPNAWAPVGGPPERVAAPDDDPFLGGNEHATPPEIDAVGREPGQPADSDGWLRRSVPNLYPSLIAGAPEPAPTDAPRLLTCHAGRGVHEVLISSPAPIASLGDLDVDELRGVVAFWQRRLRAVRRDGAAAVHLWLNEGAGAGASLEHSHAQLLGLDDVPDELARERDRFRDYTAEHDGADLLADLVEHELRDGRRLVAADDRCVLLCAYAPRQPFEMLIAPRRARPCFDEEPDGTGAEPLAEAFARLRRAVGGRPALNLWVRTAVRGTDAGSWRIAILPRLAGIAGLELGTGLGAASIAPEDAAARLRAEPT